MELLLKVKCFLKLQINTFGGKKAGRYIIEEKQFVLCRHFFKYTCGKSVYGIIIDDKMVFFKLQFWREKKINMTLFF